MATVTEADGSEHRLAFNGTLGEFVGSYKTNSSTPLGSLVAAANVTDLFGNTATGSITIQIIPAVLSFSVDTPTAQRTTMLNVTSRVTYPDGSIITPAELPAGFNVTVSKGNFTWSSPMGFNQTTPNDWGAGFRLSQNATVGDYAVAMNATDPYGNNGTFLGTVRVVPATFIIELPRTTLRASPNTLINVVVNVVYPNGSALIPSVGGVVTASLTNSSGTFTFPLFFNATDRTWLLKLHRP